MKIDVAKATVEVLHQWKGWLKEPPTRAKFDSGLTKDEAYMHDVEAITSQLATVSPTSTHE